MKCVYFLIFFLSVPCLFSSCSQSKNDYLKNEQLRSSQEIQAGFCELLDNSDSFDGKEVEINAILLTGSESAFLYDPSCVTQRRLIWFEPGNESVNGKLNQYLVPESPEYRSKGVIRVKADIVGKFQTKKNKGFGHLESFDYLFTITEIKNLMPVTNDVPYPW